MAILTEKKENIFEKIAFILLNVIVADLCIFGAGRLIEFGPLTFRMVLLVLLFVACIPLFFRNIKELLKSRYLQMVLIFGVLIVISTVIGFLNNNRTGLIITDIKGFIYFAFLPCVLVLLNSKKKIETVAKVSMYAATAQAIFHIILIGLYIVDVPWLNSFAEFSYDRRFFYISYRISAVNVRVSFLSLICLLLGVAFSVYFTIKTTKKAFKIIYPVITAICGFSLLMSYTRSVYLAVAATVFALFVVLLISITKEQKKALLRHLAITFAAFAVIIAGFNITTGENYFTYGLSRAFVGIDIFEDIMNSLNKSDDADDGASTDVEDGEDDSDEFDEEDEDAFYQNTVYSDNIRQLTVADLIKNIKKSPIIGLGLGAEIPSRPDGLNEYFFLDLFSKMGIIGLISYLSPVIFMVIQLIQFLKRKNKAFLMISIWFCVLLGMMIYSYFTPCMNSSVGILPYCCIMAVFEFYKKTQTNSEG